ncbi:MAG: AAA family ATPase [Myxococcota bacterium]
MVAFGSADNHPEVVAFLRRPGVLDEAGPPDQIIETHAAQVFLAGDRAWKIKKDVRFPYLDFSRPDLRHAALARELELNQPHAPDLYLGLSRVVRLESGQLALDGPGKPVESLLRMRRFEQRDLLSTVAAKGDLRSPHVEGLARVVRRLHASAPVHRTDLAADAFTEVVSGNLEAFSDHGELFTADELQALDAGTRNALTRLAPLLNERGKEGFVRRCHGDLHLGNIVLWRGIPTPFDALEFDEALATTDVLYDLAFLLMDLLHRDQKPFASLLLNVYLAGASPEELKGLKALPLFLSTRAAVRAKVMADRLCSMPPGAERSQAASEARSYLHLAVRMLKVTPPRLVAIGGLSGSGKSTLAARLSPMLPDPTGAVAIRSDLERKVLAGVEATHRLTPDWYSQAASHAVYERLRDKAEQALAAGASVIVDAVHAHSDERRRIERVARKLGVPFDGIWLQAPAEQRVERVSTRTGDASDADADVARRQMVEQVDVKDWRAIRSVGDPAEVARQAAKAIGLYASVESTGD